jgi:WD40 repeat protein
MCQRIPLVLHPLMHACFQVLEVLHAHDGRITSLVWSPVLLSVPGADEPVAVLASSSSDRRVRIWRSPAGLQ